MLKEILRFEFDYRKRRAATYLYFGIIFLLCFAAVTSKYVTIGGVAGGQIKENSPFNLAFMTLIMTFAMTFIASAIMGVAILRDFEHKTESLMFTTPISKFDYLFGRFFGSYVVMALIYCAIWVAFMLGYSTGKFLPWDPSWKAKEMLPFNAWHYFQPFLTFGLTNLFIQGAMFFAAGALTRSSIVLYLQGILLIVLYEVSDSLLSDIENKTLASLLDPFGLRAFSIFTEYWTPAQKNSTLVPIEGLLLWNRLIWVGTACLILAGTYFSFKLNVVGKGLFRKKAVKEEKINFNPAQIQIPVPQQIINLATYLKQVWTQSLFYTKMIIREIPFIGIVLIGLIQLIVGAFYADQMYGTSSYLITANVLGLLNEFDLFFLIIVVFYSGELIWKERTVNMNLIVDAMPVPDWVNLVSKFLSMFWIYVGLILMLVLCGIMIQAAHGYFNFEIDLYFKTLFTSTLFFVVSYTLLSFFIQVMANNKFVGYALMFVFFLVTFFIGAAGIQHPLFIFNSGSLGEYSDMNKYGHFVTSFSWLKFYWFAFVGVLFALTVFFAVRGAESVFKTRLKVGKLRLSKPMISFSLVTLIAFVSSGCYVYYNTNKVNTYTTREDNENAQVDYEKTLKKYKDVPQPKIIESNLKVEIYPKGRDFEAEGFYWLKNKTDKPMQDIHIQENIQEGVKTDYLKFDRDFVVNNKFDKFGYTIYKLNQPLQSGDSVKMFFKVNFRTTGFMGRRSNTNVVQNGTFFNNYYFPILGYEEGGEISDDDSRKKFGLPEKERMMAQDDSVGLKQNLFGDDSDYIRFEMVIGTEKDQIAIAPGYLQKEWEKDDRKYFHYKMDVPMVNFYSIVSARYEVKRDKWKDVSLEIYYHKGHEYNLETMMKSMKKSLDYFSTNFSPFQFRQMRIMEFPRYSSFAQSFANTVPFSEGIGFIQKIKDEEKDLDMPYYVTAHEIGHQWWGHQVPEANVKGNAMLSETHAQYSALMVMKHTYSPELVQKFLKYELDRYLRGRSGERKKEMVLAEVEGQGYIHYQKGALVMFALQDYIGEEKVNLGLRNFLADWQYPGPDSKQKRYPTSRDLLKYLEAQTPDSLKYIIEDMFETITLFENKTEKVEYVQKSDKEYEVTIDISAEKIRADSVGNEKPINMGDWIDVGVYTQDKGGKEKLIYLQKHKVSEKKQTFTIKVAQQPSKAGIDPLNKLIDKHPDDNVKSAVKKEGS